MTQEEYNNIDWNRGNTVRLQNGKEYPVKGHKKRYLLLYSEEYKKFFVADHRIIECRTSDYVEPVVEKNTSDIEEPKTKIEELKPVVEAQQQAVAEPAPTQPKKKRKRVLINHAEKVEFNNKDRRKH